MKRLSRFIYLALIILFCPVISHAITIEEFMQKHPDGVVALCANYYSDGVDKPATWSTGCMTDDPYALNGSNLIGIKKLYDTGYIPRHVWADLMPKCDDSIDLLDVLINDSRNKKYAHNFIKEELVLIPKELAFEIIQNLFGVYDGNTRDTIKKEIPQFYLQLSIKNQLYLDKEEDVNRRLNDIDPTPPLY